MISSGMEAIIIKIAAMGLSTKKHLGKSIKELEPEFHRLHKEFGLNVCGEGGEYESFTLNCPIFFKKIVL